MTLNVPRNGPAADLVKMATDNALETLTALKAQWDADSHRTEQALKEVGGRHRPERAARAHRMLRHQQYAGHEHGRVDGGLRQRHSAQERLSQVQHQDRGRPQRFRIDARGVDAPLPPLLRCESRRADSPASAKIDPSFSVLPDLLIVDGGKGQLGMAIEVLKGFDLFGQVPVCGLAKQQEEIFLPGRPASILLPRHSQGLYLVQRVRDEAHRFAITAHRAKRAKTGIASQLDEIPGVGPTRRNALLKHFGSLEGIRAASVDELAEVPGVPRDVAIAIKEHLG